MMLAERRGSNKVFLAVATTALTGLLAWAASAVWAEKVDVPTFTQHLLMHQQEAARYTLDRQLDSVWHAEQGAKMDEVLCTVKPRSKQCR